MEAVQEQQVKRPRGRIANKDSDKLRWQITYLNPANKLPISVESYKTVEEVADRLGVKRHSIYDMSKYETKRWMFIKVKRL